MSDKCGIVGICNRTENWTTAQCYIGLDGRLGQFAEKIISNAGVNGVVVEDGAVRVELFWKGFRDYLHGLNSKERKDVKEVAVRVYHEEFPKLRGQLRNIQMQAR